MTIKRLFIANRGEIAVRIQRAAKALGMTTIQAHSDADADMLAVRLADEAVPIGPPHPTKSYLNIEAIIAAAKEAKVDAIHPGYGFLSENANFAEAVEGAALVFVGPKAETIRQLGDKVTARKVASAAGVPTVPGSDGGLDDVEAAKDVASSIGYPVMIKASAGGGGRGIRIAENAVELEQHFSQAQIEAMAAFGDGRLYLEKLIRKARHVEVQILGDGERAVHCFERECSLQRRRQKVWEEAPAAVLSESTRKALCSSATALAESAGYRGAGTLEYLYDERDDRFYFIEMNTRIQVEHPVTELVTGIDLVQEMLDIAAGNPLTFQQADIAHVGHAIEVRINAEDPTNNFLPFPGVVDGLSVPKGEGIRFDSMLYDGYAIPPFYDSLLGKLIVQGDTREEALSRLEAALAGLVIGGLPTTIPLHQALVRDSDVRAGQVHTQFLEPWIEANPLDPNKGARKR
ncbi:MAG: acetyl-CoA carboxylase biotin carboxylase subunit [Geminicoccaceae bacterium]